MTVKNSSTKYALNRLNKQIAEYRSLMRNLRTQVSSAEPHMGNKPNNG